jgi:transposase-like protein
LKQTSSKNLSQGYGPFLMKDVLPQDPTPDIEVRSQIPGRRVFSWAYKRRILDQLDACSVMGEKAALLRREGLYSSYITPWRRQLAKERKQRKKTTRGGRPRLTDAEREARQLRRENQQLKKELERARLAIEVQKKLSELLASYSPEPSVGDSNSKPSNDS